VIARPMPLLALVTTATVPSSGRSMVISLGILAVRSSPAERPSPRLPAMEPVLCLPGVGAAYFDRMAGSRSVLFGFRGCSLRAGWNSAGTLAVCTRCVSGVMSVLLRDFF
jgi:hypothetical protein